MSQQSPHADWLDQQPDIRSWGYGVGPNGRAVYCILIESPSQERMGEIEARLAPDIVEFSTPAGPLTLQ